MGQQTGFGRIYYNSFLFFLHIYTFFLEAPLKKLTHRDTSLRRMRKDGSWRFTEQIQPLGDKETHDEQVNIILI